MVVLLVGFIVLKAQVAEEKEKKLLLVGGVAFALSIRLIRRRWVM